MPQRDVGHNQYKPTSLKIQAELCCKSVKAAVQKFLHVAAEDSPPIRLQLEICAVFQQNCIYSSLTTVVSRWVVWVLALSAPVMFMPCARKEESVTQHSLLTHRALRFWLQRCEMYTCF